MPARGLKSVEQSGRKRIFIVKSGKQWYTIMLKC